MNIKHLSALGFSIVLLGITQTASSQEFDRSGKITRILTDSINFGACMVLLDVVITNGCPNNGWVSLDCKDVHYDPGEGKRKYASALTAFATNRNVTLRIDNTKKFNGYCVARRLDIY